MSVRLVEASNNGEGVSAGLEDVQAALKGNLAFSRFEMLDSQSLALPAPAAVQLKGGLTLKCSGPADNLSVRIERGGSVIVSTVLAMQPGKPVVLGGFPSEKGKLLVVLVMR